LIKVRFCAEVLGPGFDRLHFRFRERTWSRGSPTFFHHAGRRLPHLVSAAIASGRRAARQVESALQSRRRG